MTVKVGLDDFCSQCMEWQEYDEQGKCKVCGKLIKKMPKKTTHPDSTEYTKESPEFELDDEPDTSY